MEYKLFGEYITLQALLKELSIIHSGGAIKGFLANNTVLFNGEDENIIKTQLWRCYYHSV